MIKTIRKGKKCRKKKWLSEEVLQITEKRREAKGKGEKERYTHLNAELCPTLGDPMDCSLPGSSVRGISQARVLDWVTISPFQGIFLTQGSNPSLLCLLHWQVDSLSLSHPEARLDVTPVIISYYMKLSWLVEDSQEETLFGFSEVICHVVRGLKERAIWQKTQVGSRG